MAFHQQCVSIEQPAIQSIDSRTPAHSKADPGNARGILAIRK